MKIIENFLEFFHSRCNVAKLHYKFYFNKLSFIIVSFHEKKIIEIAEKHLNEEVSSIKLLFGELKCDDFSQCYACLKLCIHF